MRKPRIPAAGPIGWSESISDTKQSSYHHSSLTHQGAIPFFPVIVTVSTFIIHIQLLCIRECFINECGNYLEKCPAWYCHQSKLRGKKDLTQTSRLTEERKSQCSLSPCQSTPPAVITMMTGDHQKWPLWTWWFNEALVHCCDIDLWESMSSLQVDFSFLRVKLPLFPFFALVNVITNAFVISVSVLQMMKIKYNFNIPTRKWKLHNLKT